jgi:hypothetical protein
MSSITTPQAYEAVVQRHGLPTGPVRLPMLDRQSFIEAFNRQYHSAGLSIDRIEPGRIDSGHSTLRSGDAAEALQTTDHSAGHDASHCSGQGSR